jgi:hypothetical protein
VELVLEFLPTVVYIEVRKGVLVISAILLFPVLQMLSVDVEMSVVLKQWPEESQLHVMRFWQQKMGRVNT